MELGACLDRVRERRPLIHCITNYVTANDVANLLLACGASPIMADEPEEVEEWKEKLVPSDLDVQPLLYPLDHSKEIKAEIEEEETSSLIRIDCAVMPGR